MTAPFTAGERLARTSEAARAAAARGRDSVDVSPEADPPPRPRSRSQTSQTRRGRRTVLGRVSGVFSAIVALALVGGAGGGYVAYRHYGAGLPDVKSLQAYQPRLMSRVYAGDLRLLSELATERRIFTPYAAIPDLVKRAFVAAEDQSFFSHGGVDPLAILRAAATDVMQRGQGKRPVGASTITQQVVKNMLLTNEVSVARKIKEALLAIRVERTLSKERILELYLNEIYLGEGAYGVAAAAQTYFDKSLDALTPAEAAFLAALPKAPNNYNPTRNPDAARARRDWVLDRMVETHALGAEDALAAKAQPVVPAVHPKTDFVGGADFFAEEVRRQLIDRFGADRALQGGLVVRTSLDPALQAQADRALRDGLLRYDQARGGWRGPVTHLPAGAAVRAVWQQALGGVPRPPGMLPEWQLAVVTDVAGTQAQLGLFDRAGGAPRLLPLALADCGWARPAREGGNLGPAPRRMDDVVHAGDVVMVEVAAGSGPATGGKTARPDRLLLRQIPSVQGALVTLDPVTGRVLALSGGWSFEASQFNRATQALRQPGSSFKPLVYLTAMEQNISPSQTFLDAPLTLPDGAGGVWKPSNYENDFSGWVPLHTALERSLNLVTVRVAQKVGMDAIATNAIAFHVTDTIPRFLPAALGAVDTTVLRMAGFYAALDEGGREVRPTLIDTVQDSNGQTVYAAPAVACESCNDPTRPPSLTDERRQLADPESVYQVVAMMQGVVQRGTGVAAAQGLGRAVAGKTGTTQDFNDAWFVGFTPDLVTAVWIGFDTPASLGDKQTGGALAAPIWHDFMAGVLKDRPNLKFTPPAGVTMATYDMGWGSVTDAFKPGQSPGATSGDGSASADAGGATPAPAPTHATAAGVDSGLGGLY